MPDIASNPDGRADPSGLLDVPEQELDTTRRGNADSASLVAPPTKREREAEWMRSALEITDLATLPLADLRIIANRMFRLLDSDRPPLAAAERYTAAVAEIEDRSRRRSLQGPSTSHRQVFKDSGFGSRFELFLDGSLAAYLRYSLVSGQLTLRVLVEMPGFEGRQLAPVILRHAVLHAHKRRLGVVPGCAAARTFLDQNPQYRALGRMAAAPVILNR